MIDYLVMRVLFGIAEAITIIRDYLWEIVFRLEDKAVEIGNESDSIMIVEGEFEMIPILWRQGRVDERTPMDDASFYRRAFFSAVFALFFTLIIMAWAVNKWPWLVCQ